MLLCCWPVLPAVDSAVGLSNFDGYSPSHKKNQNNLIKMGINKKRIFNFGALGINEINKYNLNKKVLPTFICDLLSIILVLKPC